MPAPLRAAWRAGLALALVASVACAQDAAVKKPRPVQPPPVASTDDDASAANTTGDAARPSAPALRGPLDAGSTTPSPVLRSAVRSRWSAPATIASQGGGTCRAQCATTRLACLAPAVQDDVQRCNTGWTSCLSTCDGLGYARAVTPVP